MALEKPFLLIDILLLASLLSAGHTPLVDFSLFPWRRCVPVSPLFFLLPHSLYIGQWKKEVDGLVCDVVKVEVDDNLSKEKLLETFIACGGLARTHTYLLHLFSIYPLQHLSFISCGGTVTYAHSAVSCCLCFHYSSSLSKSDI